MNIDRPARRILALGLVLGLGLDAACLAARAEPVKASRTAYFHARPSETSPVLDEVERDKPLDLRSCADGWCEVVYGEVAGYVREAVVRGPNVAVKADASARDCFSALQPGAVTWQTERFCPSAQ